MPIGQHQRMNGCHRCGVAHGEGEFVAEHDPRTVAQPAKYAGAFVWNHADISQLRFHHSRIIVRARGIHSRFIMLGFRR